MGIGKRIEIRLNELTWKRNDLLAKVPDLTPQALSNLIRRDSARSEWDEKIAAALKTSVLWLVYGKDDYPKPSPITPPTVDESAGQVYSFESPQVSEVVAIMKKLPLPRQEEILRFAQERLQLENSGARNSTQRASQ